jgi:hypothetical protein
MQKQSANPAAHVRGVLEVSVSLSIEDLRYPIKDCASSVVLQTFSTWIPSTRIDRPDVSSSLSG